MNRRRLGLICLTLFLIGLMCYATPWHIAHAYSTYEQAMLDAFGEHLIGFWPFNEITGTTIYDISGNGHNGTYYGVTLDQIDGPSTGTRAALWDGINDYGNVFSSGLASQYNNETGALFLWIRTPDTTWTNSANNYILGFTAGVAQTDYLLLGDLVGNTGFWGRHVAGEKIKGDKPNNVWTSIGIVWESGNFKLYCNGVASTPTAFTPTAGANLVSGIFGATYNHSAYYFSGYLADALLLDRVPTVSEINNIVDPNPIPTNTPTTTLTPTSFTPRPPELIATLQNGNQWELDYRITAGDIALSLLGLILLGLTIFYIIYRLVRR